MPRWREEDLGELETILQRIEEELKPLQGKNILVLCCGAGQVALRLAKKMAGSGQVVGLDLSDDLLERARKKAKAEGLEELPNSRRRRSIASLFQMGLSTHW